MVDQVGGTPPSTPVPPESSAPSSPPSASPPLASPPSASSGSRGRRWFGIAVVVLVLAVGGLWTVGAIPCSALSAQPECWVAMLPGPTEPVDDLVEVSGTDTHGSEGEFFLTTVLVDNRLTVREYVEGLVDGDVDLILREELYPPGRTVEDARFENEILMSDSQLDAKVAALRELGIDYENLPDGAEVVTVLEDSPATETELSAGDVVIEVDGAPIEDVDHAIDRITTFDPGDRVTLTVQRRDGERRIEVELGENPDEPGRPFLGVLLRNYQQLPLDIAIDAGNIGGPSAGLVFSLGIIDRVTADDLTGGKDVAATGTITAEGRIGPIGGIVQKIVGAAEADEPAEVFLVPAGNWEEAQTATPSSSVTLVEVATLDEAVDALTDLAAGRRPEDAVAIG